MTKKLLTGSFFVALVVHSCSSNEDYQDSLDSDSDFTTIEKDLPLISSDDLMKYEIKCVHAIDKNTIFMGGSVDEKGVLLKSMDGGKSWECCIEQRGKYIYRMGSAGNLVYGLLKVESGDSTIVYYSESNFETIDSFGLDGSFAYNIGMTQSKNIFAIVKNKSSQKMILSNDKGDNWIEIKREIGGHHNYSDLISIGEYIYGVFFTELKMDSIRVFKVDTQNETISYSPITIKGEPGSDLYSLDSNICLSFIDNDKIVQYSFDQELNLISESSFSRIEDKTNLNFYSTNTGGIYVLNNTPEGAHFNELTIVELIGEDTLIEYKSDKITKLEYHYSNNLFVAYAYRRNVIVID